MYGGHHLAVQVVGCVDVLVVVVFDVDSLGVGSFQRPRKVAVAAFVCVQEV